jgi:TRAP transporter TAXI family solute receptor
MPHPPVLSRRAVLLGTAAVLAGCATDPGPRPDRLRIATGPPGAVYRKVGEALAQVLRERFPDADVRWIKTGASVDNLRLLHEGGTDLAFVSIDSAVAGLNAGVPKRTTAVARLYDSFIQLVIMNDAPIHRLADLTGKRVSIGARGSGTEFITQRMLGLNRDVKPNLVNMDQLASADALYSGKLDAFFTLTGVPTPAITGLLKRVPLRPLRLVELGDQVNRMNKELGKEEEVYAPATIASSAYPGIPATATITVANLLLVQPTFDADVVEAITATLFAERERIARGHQEANRINVRTGIATSPVPLHPGAARYYRAAKR